MIGNYVQGAMMTDILYHRISLDKIKERDIAMEFDWKRFSEYRENNRIEVKKAKGGLPDSIWETYSSMANCLGGIILLGVEEKIDGSFHIVGLDDVNKIKKEFWNNVNNKKKVSSNLLTDNDVEEFEYHGNSVLAIHIPRARREEKPVYINGDLFGGTFRRNGEGDYHCTSGEVRAMLRDQTEETSDMKELEHMELQDLNLDTIHEYRNRHSVLKPNHPWEKLSDAEYLERIGAARRDRPNVQLHPTRAGLLMFGEEYTIVHEYPEYFLDYREVLDPQIRWTDRLQSSSGDWTGNLFDFFFRIYNKLVKDLKIPFKLEGATRIDDTPVHRALREALANCLINSDFFISRGVVIRKNESGIIFENPGYIRTGKEQMLRGGVSDPRNKGLMKMFALVGIGERAGSGVPNIYSIWNDQGWETPEVEEEYDPDRTILRLSFLPKSAVKTSDKKQAIKTSDKKQAIKASDKKQVIGSKTQAHRQEVIDFLKKYGESKLDVLAEHLGLSRQRARAIISQMDEVVPEGSNRNRQYRLREDGK